MPKDYFNTSATRDLTDLPAGAKIHFIGVCGTAMGQLAAALSSQGFRVSGSDKEFYEPMGSFLKGFPIDLHGGYDAGNVPLDADLVIIGNVISYGHPEVAVVEQRNLPYSLFPKLLAETVIGSRRSIVACGTHGKSTVSALIAATLVALGAEPAYFIGGVVPGLPTSLQVGTGAVSVVEGDEYDSAFFAKVPKFVFYRPSICIINAIEFDHADIYPDLAAVVSVFDRLVRSLPEGAVALCSVDGPNVSELVTVWEKEAHCQVATFGSSDDADNRIVERRQSGESQLVSVVSKELGSFTYTIPLIGEFNARNSLAAVIALVQAGFDLSEVLAAVVGFKAPRRRQEIRFQSDSLVLIEDFAHHPTAVGLTVQAVREAYPNRRLWAVFEPRSNTCRRKIFFDEYLNAFRDADQVILSEVSARAIDTPDNLLEVPALAAALNDSGVAAGVFPDAKSIAEHLIREVGENDVVVVMSNGSFGGLIDILTETPA